MDALTNKGLVGEDMMKTGHHKEGNEDRWTLLLDGGAEGAEGEMAIVTVHHTMTTCGPLTV